MQIRGKPFPGFTQHLPPGEQSAEVKPGFIRWIASGLALNSVLFRPLSSAQLRQRERQVEVGPRRSAAAQRRKRQLLQPPRPWPARQDLPVVAPAPAPRPAGQQASQASHTQVQIPSRNSQGLPFRLWASGRYPPAWMPALTTLTLARLNRGPASNNSQAAQRQNRGTLPGHPVVAGSLISSSRHCPAGFLEPR